MPALDPITAIANAIDSVSRLVASILATKKVRHMKAALDAAERYIDVNERFGDNKNLSAEDRESLLRKFRRRFKKYN